MSADLSVRRQSHSSDFTDSYTSGVHDEAALVTKLRAVETRCANLEIALQSNRSISMALGLIMAAHHLDEAAALGVLVRISQDSNIKLRTLAERMVAAHTAELTGASS